MPQKHLALKILPWEGFTQKDNQTPISTTHFPHSSSVHLLHVPFYICDDHFLYSHYIYVRVRCDILRKIKMLITAWTDIVLTILLLICEHWVSYLTSIPQYILCSQVSLIAQFFSFIPDVCVTL